MRDLAEIGLSPENCEQWFERAVLVFVAVMFIIIVLRVSNRSFFATIVPLLTDIPFIVTPRDRRGELLQAGVAYLERHPVKKRRRTAAHLPPPILYFGSAHRLV
jgi:hypothetical protein